MTAPTIDQRESRQLNLGLVPTPLCDGLDYFASRNDLSRAQLVRRILAGWLTARFEDEATAAQPPGEDSQ